MVTHTCEKCDKTFKQACNYKRHLARKTACVKPTTTVSKPEIQKSGNRLYVTVENLTMAHVVKLLGDNLISISKELLQKSQYVEPVDDIGLVEPIDTELVEEVIEAPIIQYFDGDDSVSTRSTLSTEPEEKKTKSPDISITEPVIIEKSEFEKQIELEMKRDEMIKSMNDEYITEIKKVYNNCHLEQRRTVKINSLKRKLNKNINSLKKRTTLPSETPTIIEPSNDISVNDITNVDVVVEYADKLKDTVINNRMKAFNIADKTNEETAETTNLLKDGESSLLKLGKLRKALKCKDLIITLPKPDKSNINFIDHIPEMEYIEIKPQSASLSPYQVGLVEDYFNGKYQDMPLKDRIIKYLPSYDGLYKNIISIAHQME